MIRRDPKWAVGIYYTQSGTGYSASSPTLNYLRVFPIDIPRAMRFDRIASLVAVLGASATIRWGIYKDNGASYPATLILDSGAVGDASTTGLKEATIDTVLGSGRYWLAVVIQGADCQLRSHYKGTLPGMGSVAASVVSNYATDGGVVGFFTTGVTGALPATFPAGASTTNQVPVVFLRRV